MIILFAVFILSNIFITFPLWLGKTVRILIGASYYKGMKISDWLNNSVIEFKNGWKNQFKKSWQESRLINFI